MRQGSVRYDIIGVASYNSSTGISNSTRHSGRNLPVLVMGGGAGRLHGGQHLTYSDRPTMANLLVTLMDKLDVPVEKLGGSTGALPIDTLSGL